jgi:hypothetical protein
MLNLIVKTRQAAVSTLALLLLFGAMGYFSNLQAQTPLLIRTPVGQDLLPEEKWTISARVRRTNQVKAWANLAHKLRDLRIYHTQELKDEAMRHVAKLLMFNYALNKAYNFTIDVENGGVSVQELSGKPAASEEEKKTAALIISTDPVLGLLVERGSTVDGGMIEANAPAGHPANHRYIQMMLLSPDRLELEKMVVVDLTEDTIASVR